MNFKLVYDKNLIYIVPDKDINIPDDLNSIPHAKINTKGLINYGTEDELIGVKLENIEVPKKQRGTKLAIAILIKVLSLTKNKVIHFQNDNNNFWEKIVNKQLFRDRITIDNYPDSEGNYWGTIS